MATLPLGWIEPQARTKAQQDEHERIVAGMPPFQITANATGETSDDAKKVVLSALWSHSKVVATLGFNFTRFHQLTGSCVGAGGGNAVFTMQCIEVLKFGDPEKLFLPLWLLNYGKSRQRGGLLGRGEGSFGSAFAESLIKDGVTYAGFGNAPPPKNSDGIVYTEQIEMTWSDGAAIPQMYLTEAKAHPVKTAAEINSVADAKAALRNGYPLTFASPWFIGQGRVKGSGFSAAVVGALDSSGGHQTSIHGYWEHPDLGLLFLNQNNWPASVYPADPQGVCPPCSVWQPADDLERALRNNDTECYALSGYDGYPEQKLPVEAFLMV